MGVPGDADMWFGLLKLKVLLVYSGSTAQLLGTKPLLYRAAATVVEEVH